MRTIAASLLDAPSPNLNLILLPVAALELGLLALSLVDLFRPERQVLGDNKVFWGLVILCIGGIGPIVYLLFGRKQD